jgi:DNA-binding response OmpR family regulator
MITRGLVLVSRTGGARSTMILILSHDPDVLRASTKALTLMRAQIAECSDPNEAMDFATDHEPEVIVVEMSLPGFSGAAFSTAYRERFPARDTLFVFLFEPGEASGQLEQIDNSGDDFVVKPIVASEFRSRVNLVLRRNRMGTRARFRGNVKTLPLVEVIQFCERTALTGRICVSTPRGAVQVRFRAGELKDDDGALADRLGELMDLEEGEFIIESSPVSFDDIENARHTTLPPSSRQPKQVPIARTSALHFGKRELTLRTEYAPESGHRVTTIISLDEKTVREYSAEVEPGTTGPQAWHYVNEYHRMVEDRVRTTIDQFFRGEEFTENTGKVRILPSAMRKMNPEPDLDDDESAEQQRHDERALMKSLPPAMSFEHAEARERLPVPKPERGPAVKRAVTADKETLFDEAIRKWRNQELTGALELMEKAEALDPGDRSLQVCLRVLRRRLESA